MVSSEVAPYILVGGESTRFGSDKALANHEGVALWRHVVLSSGLSLRDFTAVVAYGSGSGDAYDGIRTIPDRRLRAGPLGGLHAALVDAESRGLGWVALYPCDVLGLDRRWTAALIDHRRGDAVAFRGERWEPLPALYHVGLRPVVEERLKRGPRALWRLLDVGTTIALPLPDNWSAATRITTSDDLSGLSSG